MSAARTGNGPYCFTTCPTKDTNGLVLDEMYTHATITGNSTASSSIRCSYATNISTSDSTFCDYSILTGSAVASGNYDGSSTAGCLSAITSRSASSLCLDNVRAL